MSNFIIKTDSVTVMADFLEKDKTYILDLVHVDNAEPSQQFVPAISKNTQLHGLIVERKFIRIYGSLQKALMRTGILKQLKALKDIEFKKKVAAECGHSREVQMRYTRGSKRAKILAFPATFPMIAPQVSTVESVTMVVECSHSGHGLVMLLTKENLQYLRSAVSAQLESGQCSSISHKRNTMATIDRVDTGVPNLYWSYIREAYRAVFCTVNEDGTKKKTEFYTKCKDLAMIFVNTGNRPERRDARASPESSGAEDEDEASSSGNEDRTPA